MLRPMESRLRRGFQFAAREALKSQDKYRVGAIIIKGSNIISQGFNQGRKTHPIQASTYPERAHKGVHAEIHALKRLRPYDVEGCDMFVVRLKKDDSFGLSYPCSPCRRFISSYGIKRVYFSTGDSNDSYGEIRNFKEVECKD